jgi:hypothetical protein
MRKLDRTALLYNIQFLESIIHPEEESQFNTLLFRDKIIPFHYKDAYLDNIPTDFTVSLPGLIPWLPMPAAFGESAYGLQST